MQPMRGLTIALLITFSIGISLTARAQPTDPGFPYVDVNNDGVYSPASGDIPLTSGQILSVIQSIGYFDTQRSVNGIYHAPDHRASLVIPASVSLSSDFPIKLRAGRNIVVHGFITAPKIHLRNGESEHEDSSFSRWRPSCEDRSSPGQIDLTGSFLTFTSELKVKSKGEVIMDGTIMTDNDPTGKIKIKSKDKVSSLGADILAGNKLRISGEEGVDLTGSGIVTTGLTPETKISSDGQIVGDCFVATPGVLRFSADDGGVSANAGSIFAVGALGICSDGPTDVSGGYFVVTGPMIAEGEEGVNGNSSIITSGQLRASGEGGVSFDSSYLDALSGPISAKSEEGSVSFDGANIATAGGLAIRSGDGEDDHPDALHRIKAQCEREHEGGDIDIAGATIVADHFVKLNSGGSISADYSSITPYGSPSSPADPDTPIALFAEGPISADGATWTVPASIFLGSEEGNITAASATMSATGTPGTITFYAGGGTITVSNSTFQGVVRYQPDGVTVVGP